MKNLKLKAVAFEAECPYCGDAIETEKSLRSTWWVYDVDAASTVTCENCGKTVKVGTPRRVEVKR